MNFLSSTQAEYICKEWLLFETVLGIWNFSAVLQNVCLDNLNVFCLCKYAGHMFCICTLLCFSLQINKLQKKYAVLCQEYAVSCQEYAVLCQGYAVLCQGCAVLCKGHTVLCQGYAVLCQEYAVLCQGYAVLCQVYAVLCQGKTMAICSSYNKFVFELNKSYLIFKV